MGFLDDIKNRLPFGQNAGGYGAEGYADEGYDDGYYDDGQGGYQSGYGVPDQGYSAPADQTYGYGQGSGNGMLGQTHRGEAESVAVYTRSGQPVGESDRHATAYAPSARQADAAYRPGAYDTPSSYAEGVRATAAAAPVASADTPIAQRASQIMNSTPQLPVYVLRPESYDDVQTVVRRVRTKQPVALVFVGVRTEVAKRVLDFSYGFACGLGASVKEVGDRVFIVLPEGCEIKESDLAKLRADGYLKK